MSRDRRKGTSTRPQGTKNGHLTHTHARCGTPVPWACARSRASPAPRHASHPTDATSCLPTPRPGSDRTYICADWRGIPASSPPIATTQPLQRQGTAALAQKAPAPNEFSGAMRPRTGHAAFRFNPSCRPLRMWPSSCLPPSMHAEPQAGQSPLLPATGAADRRASANLPKKQVFAPTRHPKSPRSSKGAGFCAHMAPTEPKIQQGPASQP